jgi:hypothetical protein
MQTHCKRGHRLDKWNKIGNECRLCVNMRHLIRRIKNKENVTKYAALTREIFTKDAGAE